MKGDFSRSTFRKEKHYSKVYQQQGRVSLDQDLNEQAEIFSHFLRSSSKDIVGYSGTPIKDAGFKISPIFTDSSLVAQGPDFAIGGGKYFVDGILCENEKDITAKKQPDLVTNDNDNPVLPKEPGAYLVYLDVWERHITSLDDEQIREVALGGTDTTTRAKIVWQVKTKRIGSIDSNFNCLSEFDFWNNLITRQSNATMNARAVSIKTDSEDLCMLPPDTKYQGLENQLYRVEVHDPGNTTKPLSIKWSRNNGCIVTKIDSIEGNTITIQNLGKDKLSSFEENDWVEVTDEQRELLGKPGIIARIIDLKDLKLELEPDSDSITSSDNIQNNILQSAMPKVRKWNMKEGLLKIPKNRRSDSNVPTEDDFWFKIEDGIEIKLGLGQFRTGDYWLIPARTATHDIEWPSEEDSPVSRLPLGITHNYARLGIIKFDGTKIDTNLIDCRKIFPDLTSLASLHYVGGDGQVGKKNTSLSLPIQVGVSNGQYPLEGIAIEFQVKNGGGGVNPVLTRTNPDGIASCTWTLGENQPQQVIAVMKNEAGQKIHLPVLFNASIKEDGKAGNCTISIGPNDTVDEGTSLGKRIQELKKFNGGKICLSSGEYQLSDTITINQLNNITIEGTGYATKLIITNKEAALHFIKCNNIHIDNLQIMSTIPKTPFNKMVDQPGLNGVLTFTDCHGIKITRSKLKNAHGLRPTRSCVAVYGNEKIPSSNVHIGNCELEIGPMQIGILATNVSGMMVEDNYLKTLPIAGRVLPIKKTDLFKNNPILSLLVSRLGNRGTSAEAFAKASKLEVELVNKIKTGLTQNSEGKHDEALKTMNSAKKIGDKIDKSVDKGKTISKSFVEHEILTIFDRAKLERTDVINLIKNGIKSANLQNHDEARKLWENANTKENSVNELTKIADSLFRRSIDENKIKADLSRNQDLVYSAATWNFDRSRFNANDFKIIKGMHQELGTGYQAIVIGGMKAEKIRIQNNIIKRIIQGIHVGVSNGVRGTKQNINVAKNISISNNIIESEFSHLFPKQKHGIFVGNSDVVYVKENQIVLKETNHAKVKSQAGPASEGIRIFGYYGSMLRIVGNKITGAKIGVSLTNLGFIPNYSSKYGLWLLRENVVTKYFKWPFYFPGKFRSNILFENRDNLPGFAGPLVYAVMTHPNDPLFHQ